MFIFRIKIDIEKPIFVVTFYLSVKPYERSWYGRPHPDMIFPKCLGVYGSTSIKSGF